MRARVRKFDGGQQSANGFLHSAWPGACKGIADDDAFEEKFQSWLKRIVQCVASAFSPMHWRMCPPAGTVLLALASSGQSLIRSLQPQIFAVTPIAQRIAASKASGTSNALGTDRSAFLPPLTGLLEMEER
jgi:hypothetical protein